MKPNFFLAGSTYHRPVDSVTDEHLARFRSARGLVLPESFEKLLRLQNGGVLRYNLFVSDDNDGQTLRVLPGIGEERYVNSHDLLEVVPIEDEQGSDISRDIVVLGYEPYAYVARDYRECGPHGEPAVVTVDKTEKPTIISKIAGSFQEFRNGLQRGDSAFYVGFYGAEDVAHLATSLAACLGAKVKDSSDQQGPLYCFYHPAWKTTEIVELKPNLDYAYNDDDEEYLQRSAGPYFPEFPECSWMLECDMPESKFVDVWEKLERGPYHVVPMHRPVNRDDDWEIEIQVARPTLLRRFLPGPVARWLRRVWGFRLWSKLRPLRRESAEVDECEIDLHGIIVLWPGSLGSYSLLRGYSDESEPTKNDYTISGDHHVLRVVEGHLSIEYLGTEFHFGAVKKGDRISVVDQNTVIVNCKRRSPEQIE